MNNQEIRRLLEQKFVCGTCNHQRSMARTVNAITGMNFLEPPLIYVTCLNCGCTEIYHTKVLGKKRDPGAFLDALFASRRDK